MSAPLRKGWCPGALRPMPVKDGLLVRLRITGGILRASTAVVLAGLAERCGSGLFDLSSRGNLQMRGVREDMLVHLQDGLIALGLLDDDAAGEAVRNVVASPLAGLHRGPDIRPLTHELERRLVDDALLHKLPPKFGFLIDDGSHPSLADVTADVRFDWTGDGFSIGLSGVRDEALRVGVCSAEELVERAARLGHAAVALFGSHPDARRMRDLVAQTRVEAVLDACDATPSPARGRRLPPRQRRSDEGASRLTTEYSASGDLPHPTPADAGATFSRKREKERATQDALALAAPFGRLDTTMLQAAAATAETTLHRALRLTPWRTILVPGASDIVVPGFITDADDPRLRIAACVGKDGCAQGTTWTRADAARLAGHLDRSGIDDILLHISGCAKGCAKASPSPVTLVARDGRYDLVRNGRAGDAPRHTGLSVEEVEAHLASALEPA